MTACHTSLPPNGFTTLSRTRNTVNTGVLVIGLIAVAAGLPSVFRPQAVIDFSCEISPFCRSPRQLSYAGQTYNSIMGVGLTLVGILLIAGGLAG